MRIVEALRTMGYTFHLENGAIRYKLTQSSPPPHAAILLTQMKEMKAEVIAYLATPWSPECIASEQSFGHGPARLYPFLEKTVATPLGVGRLWQVGTDMAGVVLSTNPGKVTFIPWYDVRPPQSAEVQP